MKYKHFSAPFFNHFMQPSPPTIAKSKSIHGVMRGQLFPWKWSHPFVACPSFDNFKIPPPPNLHGLPTPINMTTMIKQNTKFPPTARYPRHTWSPGYSLPPQVTLDHYRGQRQEPHHITVFDTYLTPRSPGAWVWAKILQIRNPAP